jgi:hypothetical protein
MMSPSEETKLLQGWQVGVVVGVFEPLNIPTSSSEQSLEQIREFNKYLSNYYLMAQLQGWGCSSVLEHLPSRHRPGSSPVMWAGVG